MNNINLIINQSAFVANQFHGTSKSKEAQKWVKELSGSERKLLLDIIQTKVVSDTRQDVKDLADKFGKMEMSSYVSTRKKGFFVSLSRSIKNWFGRPSSVYVRKTLIAALPAVIAPDLRVKRPHSTEEELSYLASLSYDGVGHFLCFNEGGPTEFLSNYAKCELEIQFQQDSYKFCNAEAAFQWLKYANIAEYNFKDIDMFIPSIQTQITNARDGFYQDLNLLVNAHLSKNELDQILEDLDMKLIELADLRHQEKVEHCMHPQTKKKALIVIHPDWRNGLREQCMWEVLQEKFDANKHPELNNLLKTTGYARLLNHSKVEEVHPKLWYKIEGDQVYWSDNFNGNGANVLGRYLEAIRAGQTERPDFETYDPQSFEKYDLNRHFKKKNQTLVDAAHYIVSHLEQEDGYDIFAQVSDYIYH